jgi:4-hydroxy-tetrahydrodipicolinate synthase
VTLFDDNRAVDEKGTADLAARLVDDGVSAVLVAGSTGEAHTLDDDERRRLLDAVRARLDGVPVLAGTGGSWAGEAVRRTVADLEAGADAALVLSPPRVADPRAYYGEVAAAAGDLPLLAYHFPAVSPPGIPVELLPDLPVLGMKDSSGDPERLLAELSTWDGLVYPGAATLLSFAGPLGCPGAILALANAAPEECAAAFGGDAEAQLALTAGHLTSSRDFPVGLKDLVAARYGTSTVARAV